MSTQVPDQMRAVSSAVDYSLKPLAKLGMLDRRYVDNVGAGTVGPNGRARFMIPVAEAGTFLNPSMAYLQGIVTNTSAGTARAFRIDGSVHSFFQRCVTKNASVLSDTNNWGALCACLHDAQTDPFYSQSMAYQGRETDKSLINGVMLTRGLAPVAPATGATNVPVTIGGLVAVLDTPAVDRTTIGNAKLGARLLTAGTYPFAIPLHAAGPLSASMNKYVPLWALSTNLELELYTVADPLDAVVGWSATDDSAVSVDANTGNALNWSLSELRYVYDTVTLSSEVIQSIQKMRAENQGGLITISHHNWDNAQLSVAGGIPINATTNLPFSYNSFEGMLFTMRETPANSTEQRNRSTVASRIANSIANFQLRIAGAPVYSTPISGFATIHAELKKFFHGFSDTNMPMSISKTAYETPGYLLGGGFIGGINLSRFSHRSDVIDSGYNSTGKQVFFQFATSANANPATMDFWALYSVKYYITPSGVMMLTY